ncbi:MAG TPA: hypothetical protein VJ836_05560 [Candidatus Saccharimonadales bacterium]|nr:hypothetical protein [Candidatus Saccharimonadales bacterium]
MASAESLLAAHAQAAAFGEVYFAGQDQGAASIFYDELARSWGDRPYIHEAWRDAYEAYKSRSIQSNAPEVVGRIALLTNRDKFATIQAGSREAWQLLGKGAHATAYSVRQGDKDYAVRVLHPSADQALKTDRYARMFRGLGGNGREQILTYFIEDGMTVSELAPGKTLRDMEPDELECIPDPHLEQLADVALDMLGYNLVPEATNGNMVYHSRYMWTLIDYAYVKPVFATRDEVVAECAIGMLQRPGRIDKVPLERIPAVVAKLEAGIRLARRYQAVVQHATSLEGAARLIGGSIDRSGNALQRVRSRLRGIPPK